MKQTRLQIFGTLALAALIASCSSLEKMKEGAKQIQYKVDPEVLEAHQGKVAMAFTANVPAKMWDKKCTAEIIPVLVYEGGQSEFPSVTVQGESVEGNNQVVGYTNGGPIKYPKQEIDFNDKMRVSDMIVRIKFTRGDESLEITSTELDMPALAHGVIATSTLLGKTPGAAAPSKDNFQRTTTEDKVAEIVYLINQADVRNGQLKKEDVKAINDYIKALNENERQNIKNITVAGYASPDGTTEINTNLSNKREASAQKVANNFLKKAKAEAGNVEAKNTPEDWEGFQQAVKNSDIQDKDLIIKILSIYSDPEVREKEIKNLSAVYTVLAKEILPALRRSTITVTGETIGKTDDELKAANVNDLNIEELLFAATLYTNANDKAKYYDAAIKNFSNDYRAYNNKGVLAYEKGDVKAAKDLFKKAESVKAAPEVENNLGVIALAEGDVNAAKEYFGKAAGTGSQLDENLGIAALSEGDYEKADSYLANSTSTNAALVKILLKKDDAALAILNANNEESGLKYYLKAVASQHKNNKDAALENLRKACDLEAKWKSNARTDMEFYSLFNDANFKKIVE